jgi:hypothetical protein
VLIHNAREPPGSAPRLMYGSPFVYVCEKLVLFQKCELSSTDYAYNFVYTTNQEEKEIPILSEENEVGGRRMW